MLEESKLLAFLEQQFTKLETFMSTLSQALTDLAKGVSDLNTASAADLAGIQTILAALASAENITPAQVQQIEAASQSIEAVVANLNTATTQIAAATAPPAAPAATAPAPTTGS